MSGHKQSIPYSEETIVLGPGERRTRALAGNKFSLYASTGGPVEIAFGEQTEFFPVKAGRSIPGPDGGFKIVRFYNPGAVDITVEFAVSIDDVRPFDVVISNSSPLNTSNTPVIPVTIGTGSDTLCGAGIQTQLRASSNVVKEVFISNLASNTATMRIGNSTTAANKGIPLAPGETLILETSAGIFAWNSGAVAENLAVSVITS